MEGEPRQRPNRCVDYAVNVMARYLGDSGRDVGAAIRGTGGAVSLCSVTTIIGYSSLLVAKNPQPEVRGRAVVAIGQYASDGAVTRLVHATRDVDARVRLAALESLSAFSGRPLAVESFERLCLDPVPAIAALARRCLRKS